MGGLKVDIKLKSSFYFQQRELKSFIFLSWWIPLTGDSASLMLQRGKFYEESRLYKYFAKIHGKQYIFM